MLNRIQVWAVVVSLILVCLTAIALCDAFSSSEHGLEERDRRQAETVWTGFEAAVIEEIGRRVEVPFESSGISRQIVVLDRQSSSQVIGAEVRVLDEYGSLKHLSSTGPTGEAKLILDESSARVEILAEGYLTAHIEYADRPEGEWRVLLDRSVGIQGAFFDYWGTRAGGGALVVAYKLGTEEPDWARVATEGPAHGGNFEYAFTNGSGEFYVAGLQPGSEYVVRAFAPCVVSNVARVVAGVSGEPLRLLGGFLQIAKIEALDMETGLSPSVSSTIGGHGVGVSSVLGDGRSARVSSVRDRALVASGIPLGNLEKSSSGFSTTLAVLTGFHDREPCLAEVRVSIPGYEVLTTGATYSPACEVIPRSVVSLRPIGIGTGSIRLELAVSGHSILREYASPPGILRLMPIGRKSRLPAWIELPLDRLDRTTTIEGVPCGVFEAELRLGSGLAVVRVAGEVSIQNATETRLMFDLELYQDVDFLITNENADRWVREFSGRISRIFPDGSTRTASFYFPGPPYTFVALPPGEYSLMTDPPVMFPPPANPREAGAKFTVGPETAGIVHDLEVVF